LEEALELLQLAMRLDPNDMMTQQGLTRLEEQELYDYRVSRLFDEKEPFAAAGEGAGEWTAAPSGSGDMSCTPLEPVQVDRVAASELTVDQFRQQYLIPGIPVVIEGTVAAAMHGVLVFGQDLALEDDGCHLIPHPLGLSYYTCDVISAVAGLSYYTCDVISAVAGLSYCTCDVISAVAGLSYYTCDVISAVAGVHG
jgi:hypothetical protein